MQDYADIVDEQRADQRCRSTFENEEGAVTGPNEAVRSELERLLDTDDTRTGDVYRHRHLTPEEIAHQLGVRTSGFVANNMATIRAVLEGALPRGATIRGQVATRVRALAKGPDVTDSTRQYLSDLERRLMANTNNGLDAAGPQRALTGRQPTAASKEHLTVGHDAPAARSISLRDAVDEALRRRVRVLVERIDKETSVARPLDYWRVVAADRPLDALVTLLRAPAERGTFEELRRVRRLDLSLEAAVVAWAADLPFQSDLVDEARARKDWYS
ncbi:hypothetical protein [Oryzihumus leptocrescens]|uniref:Uncharacterized protein n=1 Tax=Oryzihumus leptocrescens TaxID=297536 RepID=A0A542ZL00_9MICO|nr:hypothetical protein [Oryzihumus leptocrescens]TQL60968.1 hypothetical protein FB474_2371 [Oryzihumus leptocrescens]